MSTQRQLKVSGPITFDTCGKPPRAYVTLVEGLPEKFHFECYACNHITPKFYTVDAARSEWRRMVGAIQADLVAFQQAKRKVYGES